MEEVKKVCECKKALEALNKEEIAEATAEAMKKMSFNITNYPLITKIAIGGMIGFGLTTALSLYQLKKIKDLAKKVESQNSSGMFDLDVNDLLFNNYRCNNCEGGCNYDNGEDCRYSYKEGYRTRRYTNKTCEICGKPYVSHSIINQEICNNCMKKEERSNE